MQGRVKSLAFAAVAVAGALLLGGLASPARAAVAAGAPGPPGGVKAAARDHGALLTWKPPSSTGGSAITGYVIKASPGGKAVRTSAVTRFLVGGLSNGTAYSFAVAAVNASGKGPASSPSAPVTPKAASVPGPARSVSARAGFKQVSVSWTAPSSDGGAPVTAYRLTTKPATKTVKVGGSARSATLAGLTDGTSYRVSVAAVNSAGPAAPVWTRSVTPKVTAPGPPVGVTAAPTAGGGVKVGWAAPLSDGGTALTAYVVAVAGTNEKLTVKPPASSVTVKGLTAGQSYTFAVAAKNAKGKGPAAASAPATAGAAVKPRTVVLSKSSLAALTTVGTDGSLVFASPTTQVRNLVAGDVVVAGVSSATPDGLLAKVTSVSASGSAVTAATVPASLDQALKAAGFGASAQLTQGQVAAFIPARPGVRLLAPGARPASAAPGSISLSLDTELYSSSNGGKITAAGTVSLTPAMSFHASVTCCVHTASTFTATDTAAASLDFTAEVSDSFSGSYTLGTLRFDPIVFDVAGVPVVIVPTLTVKLLAKGAVVAGLTASAGASVTAGVRASTTDGTVSAQPILSRATYYTPPTLYGSLTADGGAEADLSATVDGVAGATLTDQLWLAELSADISRTPWWTLSAENILGLDMDLSLLDHTFASYHKTLSDSTVLLAKAPDPYQQITITPNPAAVAPGGQVQLHAAVAGAAAQNVTWTAPPGNGTITSGGLYTAPTTPGIYQVDAAQAPSGLNPGSYGVDSIRAGAQPPSPPLSPAAASASYGAATITWKPPTSTGGSPITSYTVTASPGGQVQTAPAAATSATMTGLTPGAIYTFTITATSGGGASLPSPATNPVVIGNVPGGDWTLKKFPLPENAGGLNVLLAAVTCPSTTVCVGVGTYQDVSGNIQGLLLTRSGTSWSASEAPLPSGAAADPAVTLGAFNCPGGPGSYPCGGGATSIACPSTTQCVAVGSYADSSGSQQGLLLTWSGSSWKAHKAPLPTGAAADPQVSLGSVACPSTTECVAAGIYADSVGNEQGLLLTWSGSSWTARKAPLPTDASAYPQVNLDTVACASTAGCAAVGTFLDSSGNTQGLLLTRSGSSWTARQAPLPAGAAANPQVSLGSVACPSAGECVAVGAYADSFGLPGLVLTWSGSSWAAAKAPLPAGVSNPYVLIFGVTCPSATVCVAAGQYDNSHGFLLTLSGSSWTAVKAPLPANADSANPFIQLGAVACSSPAACVFTGSYWDSSGDTLAFVATGSGDSWTAAEAPLPPGAPGNPGAVVPAVACYSATQCVAGGTYVYGGLLLIGSS